MPVVINSKFTPFTYDELSKPLIQATEAQMALEDSYVEASDKAAKALAMANQQTDPIAYNKLKAYADDLNYQADQLMRNGLQSGSRSALLNMKRRFNTDINPIEEAATRRKEIADKQLTAKLNNPNLIFQRDISTTSLDEFINNPQLDYGEILDGNQIRNDLGRIYSALASNKSNIAKGENIDKWTSELIQSSGYTVAEIQNMMSKGISDETIFGAIARNYLNSTGVYNWGDANAIKRAEDFAESAYWAGVGETKTTTMDNYGARAATSASYSKGANTPAGGKLQVIKKGDLLDTENSRYVQDENGNYYDTESGFTLDINGHLVTGIKKTGAGGDTNNQRQIYYASGTGALVSGSDWSVKDTDIAVPIGDVEGNTSISQDLKGKVEKVKEQFIRIYGKDCLEDMVVYFNKKYEKITGYNFSGIKN